MVEADCSGSFGCRSPKEAPRGRTLFCASPVLPGLARRGAGWSGLGAGVPPGRGKRGSRFRVPPGGAKGLSPLQWRGPSPLPQRHADLRPSVLRVAPVLRGASRAGGGNAVRFLILPGPKPSFRRSQSSAISSKEYCRGDTCSAAVRNASSQNQSEVLLSRQTCRAVWNPRRILAKYSTAPETA
jgi:hypothetical protein